MRHALRLAVATLVATAAAAAPAEAHIQVSPTVVAPNDPVKFTVLVPGERRQETTKVTLKVPPGVLPFSYEDTPGWTRRLITARNGAVDQIVWTGRLAHDGFAEFSFLAGTPTHPGQLAWKALQTYTGGTIVRWIGAPDSNFPAPVTRVVKGAPRQNAGGEGAAATVATPAAGAPARTESVAGSGDGADWVARALAIVALVAAATLGFVLGRRPA